MRPLAALGFRQAELRVLCPDAYVAGQRQFATAGPFSAAMVGSKVSSTTSY
jgi:hypothetical protein